MCNLVLKIKQITYNVRVTAFPSQRKILGVCLCSRPLICAPWATYIAPGFRNSRSVAMLAPSPSRPTCPQTVVLLLPGLTAAFLSRHCQTANVEGASELFSSGPRDRKSVCLCRQDHLTICPSTADIKPSAENRPKGVIKCMKALKSNNLLTL